jgi:hypothetical protein
VDLVRMLYPHLNDWSKERWWLPFKTAFLQATQLPADFFDSDRPYTPRAPLALQPSPTGGEVTGRDEGMPSSTNPISASAPRGHWAVSRATAPDGVALALIAENALSAAKHPEDISSAESHHPGNPAQSLSTTSVPRAQTPTEEVTISSTSQPPEDDPSIHTTATSTNISNTVTNDPVSGLDLDLDVSRHHPDEISSN